MQTILSHLTTKVSLMSQRIPGQAAQYPPIPSRHRAAAIISGFSSLLQTRFPVLRSCEPPAPALQCWFLTGSWADIPNPITNFNQCRPQAGALTPSLLSWILFSSKPRCSAEKKSFRGAGSYAGLCLWIMKKSELETQDGFLMQTLSWCRV